MRKIISVTQIHQTVTGLCPCSKSQNERDDSWNAAREKCNLSGATIIATVQAANFWEGNDIADQGRLYGTRARAILAKRKMRSAFMMVLKIA
jgi:hypothetical protein